MVLLRQVWSVRIGRTARELKVDESLITGLHLDFVVSFVKLEFFSDATFFVPVVRTYSSLRL